MHPSHREGPNPTFQLPPSYAQGQLPCDATLLHARAEAFLQIRLPSPRTGAPSGQDQAASSSFRPRLLLSEQAGSVLK
jgi:hypothetical protein